MSRKVILISVDGMRPDGLLKCGNPYVQELLKQGSYTLNAKTVLPTVTLPCHFSLFHSVPPQRHGIMSNTYVPQVHTINGLFEQLRNADKISAMFYGWEPLRDVSRAGSLMYSSFIQAYTAESTDTLLTDAALECIKQNAPDFVFLYLVETDEKGGHDNGWMSETYLSIISKAVDNIKRVIDETKEDYDIIITADHGGIGRAHGSDSPEETAIPMIFIGNNFESDKDLGEDVSILDIAPTVTDIMGVYPAKEWEGHSLLNK